MKEVFKKWYDEPEEDIDLLVDESIKADVEEWLGVDKVTVSPSGKITATAKLPLDDYLTAKILSFGNKIKVISPKQLKDAVISSAKSSLNSVFNSESAKNTPTPRAMVKIKVHLIDPN